MLTTASLINRSSRRLLRATVALSFGVLGFLTILTGCGPPQIGLEATRMPHADLLGRADMQSLRQGSFWKEVAGIAERNADIGDPSGRNPLETVQAMLKATDLSPDDLLEVRIAGALASGETRPVLFGFLLARPLDLDQVRIALLSVAEGTEVEADFTELQHPGGVILAMEGRAGDVQEVVHFGFADGGRVLFAGSPAVVSGAMDRSDSRTPAQISEKMISMQAMVSLESQAWMTYFLSADQRAMLMNMTSGDIPFPPVVELGKSLASMDGAIVEIQVHEGLDLTVSWTFLGEEDAGNFHHSLKGLTDLLKGLAGLATGGKPLHAVNGLTLEREGLKIAMRFNVTESDLLTLEELYVLNFSE